MTTRPASGKTKILISLVQTGNPDAASPFMWSGE